MTAAIRKTPTVANGGSDVGTTFTQLLDNEIEALWTVSTGYLTSIGGTANAITASSDTALVAAILAYARPMSFFLVPTANNTTATTINIDSVGVKNIVDKDGNALTSGLLVSGRLHLIIYDGTSFRLFSTAPPSNPPTPAPDIIVREEETTSTAGGTFTSGSYVTRVLNTSVRNVIGGASLASNAVTLPAGTYCVQWSAPGFSCGLHATRLFNVTDSTVIETGTAEDSAVSAQTRSQGIAVFTLSVAKAIRIEHRCGTTQATNGLGTPTTFAAKEVYTWVNIWKTA